MAKYLFENENIGFFFRDNIWVAVSGNKNEDFIEGETLEKDQNNKDEL